MTTRHHAKQAQKQKARRLLIVSRSDGLRATAPKDPQFLNFTRTNNEKVFAVYGNERTGLANTL